MAVNYAFEAVKSRASNVLGAVTDAELKLLFYLAYKGLGSGAVVEIGSFLGRSTVFLASGSKKGKRGKVYAIDPHQGAYVIGGKFSGPTYQQFLVNLKKTKVNDVVVPIKKFSTAAIKDWRQPIRLLFIDGNHSYAAVRKDLASWEPFVIDGGVVALHDALNPSVGPAKAIVRQLLQPKRFARFGVIDSIFYGVKSRPKGFEENLNWWFYAAMMKLVAKLLGLKQLTTPKKLRKFIRQYLVKTWLKKLLTSLTYISKSGPVTYRP